MIPTHMPHLFGTDGVRGKAGDYPLDHETVARLGRAKLILYPGGRHFLSFTRPEHLGGDIANFIRTAGEERQG